MAVETQKTYKDRVGALLGRTWGMLIGGEIVGAAGGETYDTTSPVEGQLLASVPFAQRSDVDRAVEAAKVAYPEWRATSILERAERLKKLASILRANAEDLGILDAVDGGNTVRAMIDDAGVLASAGLEYIAGIAMEVKGQTLPSMNRDWLLTRREPYGVVGRIVAYNHPVLFSAWKIGAPVVMGNTLVLKVPEQAPLAPLYMAYLIKDLFPPGVVNIVTGDGPTTGDALVRHPDVKRIALIGSVETGRRIQASAAEVSVKHVSLELGGKNPFIVFPDADLEKAAKSAVRGMNFGWQGESCGSTSRLFLHESIHDEMLERVIGIARNMRIGHPLDPQAEIGCLVSQQQYDKVMRYIEIGKEEGAKLVQGGRKPEGEAFEQGLFVEPTVFDGVTMGMRIAREEIFGPVLSVLTWSDKEEVIREANSVEYGLTGAVWTRDLQTALEVADRLDTGYVWINGSSTHFLGAPFSGHKNSGTDSEESIEELYSYTQLKTVNIKLE